MLGRVKRLYRSLRAEKSADYPRLFRAVEERSGEILFICFGNICRSPSAEAIWNQKLEKQRLELPKADSAGLSTTQGSKTPADFAEITREFGLDLSKHGSKLAVAELVESARVIFLMDLRNWAMFRKQFPQAMDYTFLLANFLGEGEQEIVDPYGRGGEIGRRVLGQLFAAIEIVQSRLTEKLNQ